VGWVPTTSGIRSIYALATGASEGIHRVCRARPATWDMRNGSSYDLGWKDEGSRGGTGKAVVER
jgi:hypothetical protein